MIRKPNVVKGIPSLIVRSLPTLYYYGRYARAKIPAKAKIIFDSNIKYLSAALAKMAAVISDKNLDSLITDVNELSNTAPEKVEEKVYEITRKLSSTCVNNRDALKQAYEGEKGLKKQLTDLFCEIAEKTKVVLIDNNNQADWVDNLSKKLTANCYYDVNITKTTADDFSDIIVKSDFVVFASATPQSIHEDVEFLETYRKPGIVLGSMQKDEKLDQQTMRNGSWLKNRGYDVLYKIFSPMRLFTTIDKINIKFMLNGT